MASFGDYVQRHLLRELEGIPLSHADDIDAARLLADSIAKVVALANQGNILSTWLNVFNSLTLLLVIC